MILYCQILAVSLQNRNLWMIISYSVFMIQSHAESMKKILGLAQPITLYIDKIGRCMQNELAPNGVKISTCQNLRGLGFEFSKNNWLIE